MRIAVIGSGIAGLGAAWALARVHDVTVFEAGTYLGGHAHTVEIDDGPRSIPVDTGFIVYNEANYPNLVQLFRTLGVATGSSDMSFAVSKDRGAFEYQARALGVIAQPSNLARPVYRRMIREIVRFAKEAKTLIGTDGRESSGSGFDRGDSPCASSRGLRAADDRLHLIVNLDDIASLSRGHDGQVPERSRPARRAAPTGVAHGLGRQPEYVRRVADSFEDVRLATPIDAVVRLGDGEIVRDNDHRGAGPDQWCSPPTPTPGALDPRRRRVDGEGDGCSDRSTTPRPRGAASRPRSCRCGAGVVQLERLAEGGIDVGLAHGLAHPTR